LNFCRKFPPHRLYPVWGKFLSFPPMRSAMSNLKLIIPRPQRRYLGLDSEISDLKSEISDLKSGILDLSPHHSANHYSPPAQHHPLQPTPASIARTVIRRSYEIRFGHTIETDPSRFGPNFRPIPKTKKPRFPRGFLFTIYHSPFTVRR